MQGSAVSSLEEILNSDMNQIVQETVSECLEHIESSIATLIQIEKSQSSFEKSKYDEIFRVLHSAKGALSMVGFGVESELLHQAESLFTKCNELKEFKAGIIHVTIDFLSRLQAALSSKGDWEKTHLTQMSGCFLCVTKNNFNSVCEAHGKSDDSNCQDHTTHPEEIAMPCDPEPNREIGEVIVLSDNDYLKTYLSGLGLSTSHYSCIESIYMLGRNLSKVKAIFIVPSECSVNPFIIVRIINSIFPRIKVIVWGNNQGSNLTEVADFLDKINFVMMGKKVAPTPDDIKALLRAA